MKIAKFRLLIFATITCLFSCNSSQLLGQKDDAASYVAPNLAESQQLIFETVWADVNDTYIRKDLGGADWEQINQEYADRLDPNMSQIDFHQLLKEMVAEIPDSGIQLLSRQERIDQALNNFQPFNGIGPFVAVRDRVDEERRLIVLHVIPGSPAAEAGLRSHDAILSIDGAEVKLGEGKAALNRLNGAEGSDLQLLVRSPQQEPRIVTITRQFIRSETGGLRSYVLPQTNILYIAFPPHEDRSVLNEFANVLDQLQAQDAQNKGLIFDMRLMTGEQRSAIFQLLPLFVDGDIALRNNQGVNNSITIDGMASPLQESEQVAMAIIVGRETAGPAELFAAALQDQGRAVVIGQTTAASLEEFEAHFLPDGSQLIMPISTLITTNRQRDVGQLGVEPDVLVETDWDEITSVYDPAIDQAKKSIFTMLGVTEPNDG
ncbi:MAG: carboxyl-terminal processing protease [Cellvibrionaceae bacterium]|jgi:carboxyl-terminal processing protease